MDVLVGAIEDLFARLPVALYRSGRDGTLLLANPALATLLGYESLDALEEANRDVNTYYADPAQRALWLEEIAAKGVVVDFDVELVRSDGSTVWVRDTARAVFEEDGSLAYCEGALIDVTEKVRAEKVKDEFIATVSHELRNPLSVLLGLAHELANDYEGFTEEERQEMADVMARQADDASWIIEDLLVAYRGDRVRMGYLAERFDVADEIRRVLEAEERPIAFFQGDDVPDVVADPRRTRQILRNLVSNAIKYGGDEIVVKTRRSERDDAVEILVCDNGEPIEPEETKRIFEAFERGALGGDGRSMGLGLAVARKLADVMNGSLVYDHDGEQAAFVVTLPAAT
jgi:PAS domain S-box-containing protein